jgi:hypothetical protein
MLPRNAVDFGRVGCELPHSRERLMILLRFRFDSEDQSWSTGGSRMGPESRPPELTRPQQVEFLRLVHDGLGRLMACAQLKIGERSLKRALAQSPSFRHALEQVEAMRAENLFSILYAAALRGDTRAARYLLTRHDRERTGRDRQEEIRFKG